MFCLLVAIPYARNCSCFNSVSNAALLNIGMRFPRHNADTFSLGRFGAGPLGEDALMNAMQEQMKHAATLSANRKGV